MTDVLAALPRVWRSVGLPRLRDADGTYGAWPLDSCPEVDAGQPGGLAWLEGRRRHDAWTIDGTDMAGDQTNELSMAALGRPPFAAVDVPDVLRALAARPEQQQCFRSATGCYLDLAEHPVATEGGGTLLHFMADQQWVLHWLVLLDGSGGETVVTCPEPVGWTPGLDDWPRPIPKIVPLDGSYPLEVAADSVAEFFRRFWLENELHWALHHGRPLQDDVADYADRLRSL